ncbi:Growth arrest-specific protein 7 [Channa argus]|uniref:Growth arrest-specific protein 7 n=1 Tax=Channa argus TaxID=215402 RepID=A0A6G1QR03_CHAAH|nr:Growth arrest-specific protein 7 [Channa argus]
MSGSYCKSLYPFSGEQHQQGLSFDAGEIIKVVQLLPGGWWEGEKDGARGWFPSSYVQVLERTASLSQLPVEDLKDPLPPHWKCYMSPHGRRYYVNTTNNVNGFHSGVSPLHHVEHSHNITVRKSSPEPQINCVTFPSPACITEQQLLKPNEWSYCDYFWTDKKDLQGNGCFTGFEVLLQKQLKGKQMQKEMADFVRERIRIEEEYAKNLSKLSQVPLAGQEEGTLGEAWAQLRKSLADEAEVHLKFSSKLQSEVEKPLLSFRENFKKDMKRFDHHIADLRKQLVGRYAAVEKARKALADRQKELELKTQQLEIKLSNKIEEDIKKARRKSTQAGDDLMRCVDLYNQSQCKWFEEMVTTSLTMEPVDKLLQCVDPAKDRELWVRENKTGEIRPVNIEI